MILRRVSWTGPVFKLSQNYPRTLAGISSPPWLQFDYAQAAEAPLYLECRTQLIHAGQYRGRLCGYCQEHRPQVVSPPWLHARGAVVASGIEHNSGPESELDRRVF